MAHIYDINPHLNKKKSIRTKQKYEDTLPSDVEPKADKPKRGRKSKRKTD